VGAVTGASKAVIVLFAVAVTAASALGGIYVGQGRWADAACAYAGAAMFLVGLCREVDFVLRAGEEAEADALPALPAPVKKAGPLGRLRAARRARRVTRGACDCPRYWATLGADHDDWCPQRSRSAA
jgi:hypothetical protein